MSEPKKSASSLAETLTVSQPAETEPGAFKKFMNKTWDWAKRGGLNRAFGDVMTIKAVGIVAIAGITTTPIAWPAMAGLVAMAGANYFMANSNKNNYIKNQKNEIADLKNQIKDLKGDIPATPAAKAPKM